MHRASIYDPRADQNLIGELDEDGNLTLSAPVDLDGVKKKAGDKVKCWHVVPAERPKVEEAMAAKAAKELIK